MGFVDNVEGWFSHSPNEQWVLTLIAKAQNDVGAAAHEVQAALNWIAAHAGEITADVQMVEAVVVGSGLGMTPQVQAAIAAANVAVTALNAYAAKANAGSGDIAAVQAGYIAAKQAQAASASAAAALAQQKPVT